MAARFRNQAPGADALPPVQALALARTLLAGHGFSEVARNARGDSFYLARGDDPGRLRLSNHARTPKQRRGHPEVLASLVIRQPRTHVQVAAMVEAALRDVAGGLLRRDQAAIGSGSDKTANIASGSS
ncbi:hypothetical protein ASG52_21955 [Methylobacterium sp. Leaf456]|uniref:hypothetical protein n=1 Tax=Methylobacterium sp. Leaf456 TaxID=1736382 RepID=UPI0006F91DCD|nr:hypothetical protein [Methylobacterium sp. Leaf456]KQT58510.1 hypothetical protein ASG52_21955 [Methylobacterium sp. Leaf456]